MAHGAVKVCGKRHILEPAVAEIAIEDIPAARQAPGPAKDSKALPQTGGIFARGGGMCKVEARIVRDGQVELPIPIVIHEAQPLPQVFPSPATPAVSATSSKVPWRLW